MFSRHFSECGVANPSWMELKHFLKFLYAQFEDCECSIFCNAAVMEQDLPGFKTFVVKFMLKMSKVDIDIQQDLSHVLEKSTKLT